MAEMMIEPGDEGRCIDCEEAKETRPTLDGKHQCFRCIEIGLIHGNEIRRTRTFALMIWQGATDDELAEFQEAETSSAVAEDVMTYLAKSVRARFDRDRAWRIEQEEIEVSERERAEVFEEIARHERSVSERIAARWA